jgi:hypothetical protein
MVTQLPDSNALEALLDSLVLRAMETGDVFEFHDALCDALTEQSTAFKKRAETGGFGSAMVNAALADLCDRFAHPDGAMRDALLERAEYVRDRWRAASEADKAKLLAEVRVCALLGDIRADQLDIDADVLGIEQLPA